MLVVKDCIQDANLCTLGGHEGEYNCWECFIPSFTLICSFTTSSSRFHCNYTVGIVFYVGSLDVTYVFVCKVHLGKNKERVKDVCALNTRFFSVSVNVDVTISWLRITAARSPHPATASSLSLTKGSNQRIL
uniref:Phlebovirus_G2 domain-containing protein n=1 Tax=Steinernema glaseri TaxID=37863 RepID=A0A1I7YUQ0_9BILA